MVCTHASGREATLVRQGGDEHDRPLETLCLVDGRQVDRVDVDVGFAVEALVRAAGMVGDKDGERLVVPESSVLAADLFAGHVSVWSGPSANRLVVGQQGGEPREGS